MRPDLIEGRIHANAAGRAPFQAQQRGRQGDRLAEQGLDRFVSELPNRPQQVHRKVGAVEETFVGRGSRNAHVFSACTDLCGRCLATGAPTATPHSRD